VVRTGEEASKKETNAKMHKSTALSDRDEKERGYLVVRKGKIESGEGGGGDGTDEQGEKRRHRMGKRTLFSF